MWTGMWTADPEADFLRYSDELERALERLPKCCQCGEHIQQDTAVRIGCDWYCDECLEDMREEVEEE